MICYNCNTTMTDYGGGFYECPRCGDIFDNTYEPIEDRDWPTKCDYCDELSLYHKAHVGYIGLYHCASCGVWIDRMAGKSWKITLRHDRPPAVGADSRMQQGMEEE